MKKTWLVTATSILLTASILGACSNNKGENEAEPTVSATATAPVIEATASPEASTAPVSTEPQASASPEATGTPTSDRPATRAFGDQEGGVKGQEGTLVQGDGFSLYVFKGFVLDAQSGRLSLTGDGNYYAEIEPLPSGYDLAALKQQGEQELSAAGEAKDYSGELAEHPLGYAELYLQATGEAGILDYMVWKNPAEDAFLFRIHIPKGELSSTFSPWIMVSLSTVESK